MEHGAAYPGRGCAHCGHQRPVGLVTPIVGRINRG
jgi:hypothetical protein